MRKSEIKDNNIFMWATKELSQDAVVAWLLNSELGKDFVVALLGDFIDKEGFDAIRNKNFDIVDIETQKNSIDVLVTLKVEDNYQAIIIEDKINSFLHNNQMLRYIEKVSQKQEYTKIYFVLFKTGTVFEWEKEEFDNRRKQIDKKTYELNELNDYFSDEKHLLMTGTYYDTKIDLTSFCGEKDDIIVPNIFDYESFSAFLNNKHVQNLKHSNDILELIQNYYLEKENKGSEEDNNTEKRNSIYRMTKEFLKEQNKGYKLRMLIPPGNGEREYDGCILKDKYIHFNIGNDEFTPKAMKECDNFLVLPFIRFISDNDSKITHLEFGINYSLISNLKNLHGYQSYAKTVKSLKINKEKWYENEKNRLKVELQNNILQDHTERFDKDKTRGKLKFVSWKVDIIDKNKINKNIIKENLEALLSYADKMADVLSDNKKN